MEDNRTALPRGYDLRILDEDSHCIDPFTIIDEIGRGGSCLVYKGKQAESINGNTVDRTVVIKEFYPSGLDKVIRNENGGLDLSSLNDQETDLYRQLRNHFGRGQEKNAEFYEYYRDQSLPRIFSYGEANNTVYAVSDPGIGRTLSEIRFDSPSLNRAVSIMESICDAIGKIHTQQKLYLDCKPDNFFYYYENKDLQSEIYLFDFDTVVSIDDIRNGKNTFYSASLGWVPPEQFLKKDRKTDRITGYRDPQNIGYHTDIYSVGAVFFWLLAQRKPTELDIRKIQENTFDWEKESSLCTGVGIEIIKLVQDMLHDMLQPDTKKRQQLFHQDSLIKEVRGDFERLYGLTVGDNVHFEPIHTAIRSLEKELLLNSKQIQENVKKVSEQLTSIQFSAVPDSSNKEQSAAICKKNKTEIYLTDGRCEGETKDGVPTGSGTFFCPEGRYEGTLVNGIKEGFGILNQNNGDIFIGEFRDNSLFKGSYYRNDTSELYEGCCKNSLKTGKGIIYYPDGSMREGTFLEDQFSGYVLYKDSDGKSYEEYYIDGKIVEEEQFETIDIDDPYYHKLKIENIFRRIKKKKYSFITKELIMQICLSVKTLQETNEGRICLSQNATLLKKELSLCLKEYQKEAIRSGDTSLYKSIEEISTTLELINRCQEDICGWGPQRHAHDKTTFIPYPTMNSRKDNTIIGDERIFVFIKKHGVKEFKPDVPELQPGEKYDIRVYYNNGADNSLDNQLDYAKNVRVSSFFPVVLTKDMKGEVVGVILSSNCSPSAVWNQRYIRTSYEKLYIRYVPETAILHNKGALDGKHLPEELFTNEGTYVGVDKLDGIIPGGEQYSGYVEYTISTEERAGSISQMVSYDGINYQKNIDVSPKTDIYFRIVVSNIGDTALTNVVLKGVLSKGLTLIPGSVSFTANDSGIYECLTDDYNKVGYNFGTVGTGNTFCVSYKCRVEDIIKYGENILNVAYLIWDSDKITGDQKKATTVIHIRNHSFTPWGPERKLFTNNYPAPYVTFNSITDNAAVGDERNFVRIREANASDRFTDEVKVIPGKVYEVYIYYQNDASPSLADTSKGIALDVRANSSYPAVVDSSKKYIVTGSICASNSLPDKVWDGAYVSADEETSLQYVPNSLRLHSYTQTHGDLINANEFFSSKGTLIATNPDKPGIITSKDGECSGHITYCLLAKGRRHKAETSLKVSTDGKNWEDNATVKPGENIIFKVEFNNVGNSTLTNVFLKAVFDKGLILMSGSTMIFDENNIAGRKVDDIIDISGFNLGDKRAGTLTQILFQAKVVENVEIGVGSVNTTIEMSYNSTYQGSYSVITYIQRE